MCTIRTTSPRPDTLLLARGRNHGAVRTHLRLTHRLYLPSQLLPKRTDSQNPAIVATKSRNVKSTKRVQRQHAQNTRHTTAGNRAIFSFSLLFSFSFSAAVNRAFHFSSGTPSAKPFICDTSALSPCSEKRTKQHARHLRHLRLSKRVCPAHGSTATRQPHFRPLWRFHSSLSLCRSPTRQRSSRYTHIIVNNLFINVGFLHDDQTRTADEATTTRRGHFFLSYIRAQPILLFQGHTISVGYRWKCYNQQPAVHLLPRLDLRGSVCPTC